MANSVSDLDLHDLVHFRSGICIQKKDADADLLEKESRVKNLHQSEK